MPKLTTRELNRATLARQMLLAREKTTVPKALARLLAIQAQWPKPPFQAFWTRLEGFAASDLTKLARKHAVVRGTAFRGTIFLMLPEDYAAFRATIAPALERSIASIVKPIPEGERTKLVATGRKFFAKGATFEAFRDHLEGAGVNEVRKAAYLVRVRLPLLMVPTDHAWGWPQAAEFAHTSLELAEEAAEDALVLRYLAALGPATIADAQNFLGLSKLKAAFGRLREKLVTFEDDRGKELFDLPKAPRPDAGVEAPVRFLPDFDNVILGHEDRRRIVADEHKPRVYATSNLSVLRTFLVDGMVAGLWRTDVKKTAVLSLEPLVKLTKKTIASLEEEGEKLLSFLEPEARAHEIRIVR